MVQIHITHDAHSPLQVPRTERAANIDAAAIAAIRCGWSCTITAPSRPGVAARKVEFTCGTLMGMADAEPGLLAEMVDALGRWHRQAAYV